MSEDISKENVVSVSASEETPDVGIFDEHEMDDCPMMVSCNDIKTDWEGDDKRSK